MATVWRKTGGEGCVEASVGMDGDKERMRLVAGGRKDQEGTWDWIRITTGGRNKAAGRRRGTNQSTEQRTV